MLYLDRIGAVEVGFLPSQFCNCHQVTDDTPRPANEFACRFRREQFLMRAPPEHVVEEMASVHIRIDIDRGLQVQVVKTISIKTAKTLERTNRTNQHYPDSTGMEGVA